MRNLSSWPFFIVFLAFGICVVLVSGQCQGNQQSWLLQLKNNLIFNFTLSVNLSQWNQNTDCCNWSGVDCDEAGRVISLNLSNESISGGLENASGLFNLQYLQRLNLAFNKFDATQIPSRLANLTRLTYLNLSNAGFAGQIPSSISSMTKLVILDLSSLIFTGSSVLKLENPNLGTFLQNLTEIRELYLDGVNISAQGNEWCQALSFSLPSLQILSMSNCFLSGPVDSSLGKLQSLSAIRLNQNNLSSQVPDFLANFPNLTSLHLSNCGLQGTLPDKILQLPTLESLDLSLNNLLQGYLPHFPPNNSLQILILQETSLSGPLPDSIGELKNLSRLELAKCNFTGPIPTSLANLTQLVYLDLSWNNFTGLVPPLHMSKKLSYLDLSQNLLSGAISSTEWEQLLYLAYVDLGNNSLEGRIPSSLFSRPSLKQLQLSNNQLEGQVPEFLNPSTSLLDILDLSANRLEGHIPMSIYELKQLNILLLSSNKFNGTVQLDMVHKLSNLTRLDFSYNSLVVNASSGSSFPPKISTLKLASCHLRMIPDLKNQTNLYYLDLSDNQISGQIPNWMWQVGNGSLTHLNLSHNLLVGLQEPYNLSNLSVLDLHFNQLQADIPKPPINAIYVDYSSNKFSSMTTDIGNLLPFTIFFSLSNNSLRGTIPESLCNATYVQVLDLSNNSFSGTIPTCLSQNIESLGVLNLRRNKLTGTVPDAFPGNCGLQTLNVNKNHLDGKVPKSLANCTFLEVLDLGNNQINDIFPCWLKNVSSLRVLVLRSNKFYGKIGCPEISGSWSMLQIVDLASNNFRGQLPAKCLTKWEAMMADDDKAQSNLKHLQFEFLSLSQLYYQDTVKLTIKGLEIELVKILNVFTSIDLSGNNFEGPIPEEIGRFKSLYILNMSHNALTGPIPSSLGNLRMLESLDLSRNKLSGAIPSQLTSLYFLSVLDLSYNQLVGRIPVTNQFATFSSDSYEGNEGLCGPPLTDNCTTNSNQLQPSAPASSKEFDWVFIVIGTGFGIGSAVLVAPLIFSDKVNQWYDDHIIDDVLMAILPMFGLMYKTSHQRIIEAEEDLEDENADEDEEDCDETGTEEFRGRYCVFCSKLDVTRKRVVHNPECICHYQPLPMSSSTSTSSSSSSLAHSEKT